MAPHSDLASLSSKLSSCDLLNHNAIPEPQVQGTTKDESPSMELQTDVDKSLETFILFPKLPTEIRLKVWHIILHAQHTISLSISKDSKAATNGAVIKGVFQVEDGDCGAVLHEVNTEAGEEALRFYEDRICRNLCIRMVDSRFEEVLSRGQKSMPVSFPNTTFSLATRQLLYLPSSMLGKIQHLKLSVLDPAYFTHYTADTLKNMPRLRTLILTGKEGVEYSWSWRGKWWEELVKSLQEEMRDPEWICPPLITIFDIDTGVKLAEVEAEEEDVESVVVEGESIGGEAA